jgi:putative hydrolase of the HAD superfamily
MPAMIEAVLFDLDNTLVDRDRAFHQYLCEDFNDPQVREELCRLDHQGHGDRMALLQAWAKYSGDPLTLTELGCRIAARLQPDPDLLDVLRALRAKTRLGIITNGASKSQRCKIRTSGVGYVIPPDCCWVSAEVGAAKPNPVIFLMAAEGLAVSPRHCLFIGDYWPHDGVGAHSAGMRVRVVEQVMNAQRLSGLLREEGMP